jgi:hypothetical protein
MSRGAPLVFAAILLPLTGLACPNCYGSSDDTILRTYYLSTAMLSLLPFGLVAGLFAIAWQLRRSQAEDEPSGEIGTRRSRSL